MKRFPAVITALTMKLTVLSLFFSCGPNGDPSNVLRAPGHHGEAQEVLPWKLVSRSTCATKSPEHCPGAHGFSILANKKFQVGPGPADQIVTGALSVEEFNAVDEILVRIMNSLSDSPVEEHQTSCTPIPETEERYTIVLNQKGHETEILRVTENEFCYAHVSIEDAHSLQKAALELLKKYYPIPFPDACLDAAQELENLYPALTRCSVNDECAYLDPSFQPIPKGELQFVVTDACNVYKPLAVANAISASAHQLKLLTAREKVREICGARIKRPGCETISGFQNQTAPAVCVDNQCRIP